MPTDLTKFDLPRYISTLPLFQAMEAGELQTLAEAKTGGPRVELPVSKATIASRLSMTPEYFSRVLRDLEDKGLIEVDKREIRIPDPKRLQQAPLE